MSTPSLVTHLYTDGALFNQPLDGIPADWASGAIGAWAYCHVDEHNRRVYADSGACPEEEWGEGLSPFTMEIAAIVAGLESLPEGWHGTVCSDNPDALHCVFSGLYLNRVPDWLADRIRSLWHTKRIVNVTFQWTTSRPKTAEKAQGHDHIGRSVSAHNTWCHHACRRAARIAFRQRELEATEDAVAKELIARTGMAWDEALGLRRSVVACVLSHFRRRDLTKPEALEP